MNKLKKGFLLIADISGYTAYLHGSELDHAQETLTTLLNLLIKRTAPPLVISRLAGDAVISYGLGENFYQGQTFVEMIEDTYVAFRKAINLMVMNNTCRCNACANVSSLDLKFFVHYGEFGVQALGGHVELVGSDVNLIHRLVKNRVAEVTGVRAYCLYSQAALDQLELGEMSAAMIAHEETYDHLGSVRLWVQDMHPVWQAKKDLERMEMPQKDVFFRVTADIDAPPEMVWDYLIQPAHRKILIGSDRQELLGKREGRITNGTVYQCYHGDKVTAQTVLEWRPFERILTEDLMNMIPGAQLYALSEFRLEPVLSGTRLSQKSALWRGPGYAKALLKLMGIFILPGLRAALQRDIEKFKVHIETDLAARGGLPAAAGLAPEAVERAAAEELGR